MQSIDITSAQSDAADLSQGSSNKSGGNMNQKDILTDKIHYNNSADDNECELENIPGDSDERGAGDGQEEAKVDDDEDRRNPQYIPKRGVFYEHDDREDDEVADTAKEGEEETNDKQLGKQKVWRSEQTERWGHDKFLELEQEPKSKEELVAAYGYDIRNEDNAPRSRRRRRYGRGPNKYTRKWEDEDAYSGAKSAERGRGGGRGRGIGRGGDRIPKLDDNRDFPSLKDKNHPREMEKSRDDIKKKAGGDNYSSNDMIQPTYADNVRKRGGGTPRNAANSRDKQPENPERAFSHRGRGSTRGGSRPSGNNTNRNVRNTAGEHNAGFSRSGSNKTSDNGPPAPFPNINARKIVDQAVEAKLDIIDKNMSNLKVKIDNTQNSVDSRNNTVSPKHQAHKQREVIQTHSPKAPQQTHQRQAVQHQHSNEISGFDEGAESRPKRYSSSRQPRGSTRGNQNTSNDGEDYQQNLSYQAQDQYSQESRDQQQNFGSPVTVPTPLNAGGPTFAFSTTGSGPPSNAPFLSVAGAHSNTAVAAVTNQAVAAQLAAVAGTPPYIPPPPGLAGFATGPHPPGVPGTAVQYGGVPVTVGSLTALIGAPPADLAVLAAATNPHLHPQTVSSAEQVMAIAAAAASGANAAASGNQGYAEVRGGVTYFNPTAQPTVMSRPPVNKRPKAAIPIVDPSQFLTNNEKIGHGETLSQQNSLDGTDQVLMGPNVTSLSTSSNQDRKIVDGSSDSVANNMVVSDNKAKPLTAI